jgi:uncharacterized protein (DUF1330 family)
MSADGLMQIEYSARHTLFARSAPMAVYLVAQLKIHDRARYNQYVAGFMEIFARYAGRVLAVEEAPKVLEGDWNYTRTVLLEFPSEEQARAWHESDAYQRLAQHRHAASDADIVLIQGL